MRRVYVGNLSDQTDEDGLRRLFEPHGEVASVDLATRPGTRQSRGFGFVEMEDVDAAIAALHNTDLAGRVLTVVEARPRHFRPESPSRW